MNYTEYLQQGGTAQPSIEEQVAELVQAAMSGDEQANQLINQIMQAAEQGDPKAQQIAQLIQQIAQKLQLPAAMKCGGKVRAKIKKACGGKKMEKGGEAKVKKEAKGGKPCPCTLKKVGGKLIEVDCEGNPVHYAQAGDNTGNWLTKLTNGIIAASRAAGANYTPGAGSIAGSIVDGTPSGIVGSPAQQSTGHNGVQVQNQRLATPQQPGGQFIAWLRENAPEYVDRSKRAELAAKYGISAANAYTGSLALNQALWEKMKLDKQNGMQFGGPEIVAQQPAVASIASAAPVMPQISAPQVDAAREAAIAAIAGRHISDMERQRWGAAYDAIKRGANPTGMSPRQLADIQRLGKVYRSQLRQSVQAAKEGTSLNYTQYAQVGGIMPKQISLK